LALLKDNRGKEIDFVGMHVECGGTLDIETVSPNLYLGFPGKIGLIGSNVVVISDLAAMPSLPISESRPLNHEGSAVDINEGRYF